MHEVFAAAHSPSSWDRRQQEWAVKSMHSADICRHHRLPSRQNTSTWYCFKHIPCIKHGQNGQLYHFLQFSHQVRGEVNMRVGESSKLMAWNLQKL